MPTSEIEFIPIASKTDLPKGARLVVEVDGNPIVVFNVDDKFYAIDGICSHDEEELAEGNLEGFELTCPRHGGKYDIRDGNPLALPVYQEINNYPVKTTEDEIFIGFSKIS